MAFVLLYFLDNAVYYLILIAYSFWVPQIIRNVVNNTADTLSPLYIIGVSLTKIYTPLYFFLNKNNFLMVKTNKTFGISLALHVGFQVLVLFAQRVLPRLCMPKSIIPEKYDYYREIPQSVLDNAANGRLECVICMEHVHVPREGKEEGGGEQAASNGENTKKSTATANAAASLEEGSGSHYMITPCDHVYHKKCLTQWLSCKLECPFCRAPLPSP